MQNYYDHLFLTQDCTQDEIKKAYRMLSMKFHPDKNEGNKDFAELFLKVKDAYDVLSDPIKRREYDNLINPKAKETKSTKTETTNTSAYERNKNEYEIREKLERIRNRTEIYLLKKDVEQRREQEFYSAQGIPTPKHLNALNILGSILVVLIVSVIYAKTPTAQTVEEQPIQQEIEKPKENNNAHRNTKENNSETTTQVNTDTEEKAEPEIKQEATPQETNSSYVRQEPKRENYTPTETTESADKEEHKSWKERREERKQARKEKREQRKAEKDSTHKKGSSIYVPPEPAGRATQDNE